MVGKLEVVTTLRPEVPWADSYPDRLQKLANLKDYAIANLIDPGPELVGEINMLIGASTVGTNGPAVASPEYRDRLDATVLKLTQLTYPATIDDIPAGPKDGSSSYARFKARLNEMSMLVLVLMVVGLLISAHAAPLNTGAPSDFLGAILSSIYDNPTLGNSLLAISLGFLGAAVYSIFNVLKSTPSRAFSQNDEVEVYARLAMGVLLGWVSYYAFAQTAFGELAHQDAKAGSDAGRLLVLLPFVAGYGSTLVIGLLNKVIKVTEVTIDFENRREIGYRGAAKKK